MPRDTRAGHPTHWQVFGSGPRPALALHCSLAHSGAWAGVAQHLGGVLNITAPDLPGHGNSADWDGQEDYATLSAKVAASFFEEPMELIGHSFGALLALRIALEVPLVVRSLTLIEPVLFAAAQGHPEWDGHVAEMAPFVQAMQAGDREAGAAAFTALWGAGQSWDSLSQRARDYNTGRIHLIPAIAPANYEDNAGLLAPGGLEGLVMPVMLIQGSESPRVMHRITEAIAARLPEVGVAEVKGAGHMLPVTHAAQVAGLIETNVTRAD